VGVSFISAVTTYGELSGLNGTSRGRRGGVLATGRLWAKTDSTSYFKDYVVTTK
jgi:hypothetical protein